MAEQIPYGVATSLIDKIASAAFREIGRIYGVMDDLEKLKDTLESIKVVLSDAELRQGQDNTVLHWVKRFKQVLHDADDLLDDVFIKDLRRKANGGSKKMSKVCGFLCISDNPIAFRAKLAHKIEKIRKGFNDVAEDMSKLKLNPSYVVLKNDENSWRETSSFVLQSEIIGRENDKTKIVNLLRQTDPDHNVSLVVVAGMGGLGKTALAQLVYNAAQKENMFEKYIWVCVSEDFEAKTILKKMLESLKKDASGDTLEALQQRVQEELNGQKYMLVLDDVWSEDHLVWSNLRTHLMCGGRGSKILVTTRSMLVSEAMGISIPYTLKGLTEEQSWTLLRNLAFGGDNGILSQELQLIGEKVASRCGGVPLAIKTLGGFLRTTNGDIHQWSSILNGDIWGLCKEKKSIVPVLELSYQKLPVELRQCFAYCCLYLKDWVIENDELVQLWMAQGYLSRSNRTQSLKDVGNQYVKNLMMRSFFQDATMDKFGHIKSVKMHDLIHDLATSVARNDCYLVTEGEGIAGKPMHVGFETHTNCSLDVFQVCKLRTILHGNRATELMAKLLSFTEKLNYLRALDLSITQLPKSIDKVKYLRYFDLSFSSLSSLPEEVGNLVCLQTLKLNECSNLVSLPESVGKLVCLQTLELKRCSALVSLPESVGNLVSLQTLNLEECQNLVHVQVITKLINLRELNFEGCKAFDDMMPVGLGKLTSLQCLPKFVVGDSERRTCSRLNELEELNNIRDRFCITSLIQVRDVASESHETNLRSKKYIEDLHLYWKKTNYDVGEYESKNSDSLMLLDNLCPHQNLRELVVIDFPGVKFSDWVMSLPNIVTIELRRLYNCKHLPPLDRLPCLKDLKLVDMFKLETLGDNKAANESEIHLSLSPFPCLSSLTIWNCPKLTYIPPFPQVPKLILSRLNAKPILESCMLQHETCSFCLEYLELNNVTGMEAMAENWMKNLTSLKSLTLHSSPTVEAVLPQLQHLPSRLQELEISYDDDELELWKDEDGPPPSLSSLQKITFHWCLNMEALPGQICHLQSLTHLQITTCPRVESLHGFERCFPNIDTLSIGSSPLLRSRYLDESGEDRSKISHIPYVNIWAN
ncbi:hypothetical protein PIB30_023760 [Stylosanthes scabra]|uniref:Uncharacterized protein n=1 Tax=Stylosanthes scabra TaxID=79078 RepID=A0ABU6X728_9FABA|nr:hypothetical protein [Stylosanthes scabra]